MKTEGHKNLQRDGRNWKLQSGEKKRESDVKEWEEAVKWGNNNAPFERVIIYH